MATGNFRRFERFSLVLVFGSLLLVPVFLAAHPPIGEMARDFFVPRLPEGSPLSEVMLLIIAIVGTTVAPWQLFFQQNYVIDKRISPRFISYERADLWIGILFVMIGAVAMMAFTAATFAGQPEFGKFSDAGGVASGLGKYVGAVPAVLFPLALFDACIIGASAVSLATAYAVSDALDLRHSLHRKPTEAKGFYAVYCGLIALAAALVLDPGTPLGLLTNAVQTLGGVLLPSATVFLLLLSNDKAVLGPWVNGRWRNLFTGGAIVVLVLLSIILTASVLYPQIGSETIIAILVAGSVTALVIYLVSPSGVPAVPADRSLRGYVANAAARRAAAASADYVEQGLATRSAGLFGRRGRARSRAHYHPRHEWNLIMSIFMALLGLIVLRAALLYAADLVLARIVSLATIRSLTVSVLRSLLSGARRARRLGFVTATEAACNASQKESDVMPLRQPSAILR